MKKQKVLVVGLGEVGLPIFEILKENGNFDAHGFDLDETKIRKVGQTSLPSKTDIMHICLPCKSQTEFTKTATKYMKRFQPKLTIINSTVPPEATKKIHKTLPNYLIAHSPIRGVHKDTEHMKWEIERWTKYIGGATKEAAEAAAKHFKQLGLNIKILRSSTETELAKLFETTYRAWMISCFQEMHRIASYFEADFNDVVDFLEDTHRTRLDRPIMFPGVIGGHCIIPNVKLLQESRKSEFLKLILESNEKRRQEMTSPKVRKEAEQIEKRARKLQKEIMTRWEGNTERCHDESRHDQ